MTKTDQPQPETFIISYPGSGHTWMMCLIHYVLVHHFGVQGPPSFGEIDLFHEQDPRIPMISFTHADAPYYNPKATIKTDRSEYRDQNVVLIVRDPRDVVVSCYLKHTRRAPTFVYGAMQEFKGSLSEYIRDELYDIESLIIWLNNWAGQRCVPCSFSVIRYEDMIQNAALQLKRTLDIIGIENVAGVIVDDAVQFCSFENMQARESEGGEKPKWFYWVDPTNSESHRVRRGKVGGYTDYMSEEDIQYVNSLMRELNPLFGYSDRL